MRLHTVMGWRTSTPLARGAVLVVGWGRGHGGGHHPGKARKCWGWRLGASRSSQGSSRPSAEGFGATQLSPVVISAGQRVLHHRHHLPVQHGGAVAAAPAGPGCLPQRRRLAPVWFHSRTSLLQLKLVPPKPSQPVLSSPRSHPRGDESPLGVARGSHPLPRAAGSLRAPCLELRYAPDSSSLWSRGKIGREHV